MIIHKLAMSLAAASLLVAPAYAAEMEHSAHSGAHVGVTKGEGYTSDLKKLDAIPQSGKAREAYSDERYVMESTSAENDLATQCAHGSRGLVMLDNETWDRCGGKSEGASKGPGYYPALAPWNKEGTGEVHRMDHSAHGMKH
ncbi:MAG: hypothetical protein PVF75_00875 [Granulosicoccaceae bacterium]